MANNRGTAALWAGDLEAAEQYLTTATAADLGGTVISQLNAAAYHALLRCERGELDLAEAEAQRVIHTASTAGLGLAVHVGGRLPDDGTRGPRPRRYRGGRRVAGTPCRRRGLSPEPHVRLAAAIILATRRDAAGDREAALTGLRRQAGLADWRPPRGLWESWMTTEATLLARAGGHAAARELDERMGRPTTAEGMLAVDACICCSATCRRQRPSAQARPRPGIRVGGSYRGARCPARGRGRGRGSGDRPS